MLCASITSLFIVSTEGEQEITVKAAIPAVIYKKLSKQDSCKEDLCELIGSALWEKLFDSCFCLNIRKEPRRINP